MPEVKLNASPAHMQVDAFEWLAEAEQSELDITVQVTPAKLPGQQGFPSGWTLGVMKFISP
jgi:hypothetical protein